MFSWGFEVLYTVFGTVEFMPELYRPGQPLKVVPSLIYTSRLRPSTRNWQTRPTQSDEQSGGLFLVWNSVSNGLEPSKNHPNYAE